MTNLKEKSRPVWTGYGFKDQKDDAEYLKQHEQLLVRAIHVWAACRIVFDVVLPFSFLPRDLDAAFYWAWLPNVALTFATMLVVSCIPRARRYMPLIISITSVLMACGCEGLVRQYTRFWIEQTLRTDLAIVVQQIGNDHSAVHELEEYVKRTLSESAVSLQMALTAPQIFLLAFAGLWYSTLVAAVAVALCLPLLSSPNVPYPV